MHGAVAIAYVYSLRAVLYSYVKLHVKVISDKYIIMCHVYNFILIVLCMGRSKGKNVLYFIALLRCEECFINWSTAVYETSKLNKVQLYAWNCAL